MKPHLYWIPGMPYGRLAIMPRPRGGDWLEDELKAWKTAGVDVVLSLLTPSEERDLDLQNERQICSEIGLSYISYPIPDRQIPGAMTSAVALIRETDSLLKDGNSIVIHCRMGIGRSAMIAACLLGLHSLNPAKAFETIAQIRGVQVPDTDEQRQWVSRLLKLWNTESF
jgi:protein-tyrosine phosphatase